MAGACDDGNVCTVDACGQVNAPGADPVGCQHSPADGPCDDGDKCTAGDACDAGKCAVGGENTVCNDKNPCTTESCHWQTGCKYADNDLACEDGDPVTLGDYCDKGKCQPGTPPGSEMTLDFQVAGSKVTPQVYLMALARNAWMHKNWVHAVGMHRPDINGSEVRGLIIGTNPRLQVKFVTEVGTAHELWANVALEGKIKTMWAGGLNRSGGVERPYLVNYHPKMGKALGGKTLTKIGRITGIVANGDGFIAAGEMPNGSFKAVQLYFADAMGNMIAPGYLTASAGFDLHYTSQLTLHPASKTVMLSTVSSTIAASNGNRFYLGNIVQYRISDGVKVAHKKMGSSWGAIGAHWLSGIAPLRSNDTKSLLFAGGSHRLGTGAWVSYLTRVNLDGSNLVTSSSYSPQTTGTTAQMLDVAIEGDKLLFAGWTGTPNEYHASRDIWLWRSATGTFTGAKWSLKRALVGHQEVRAVQWDHAYGGGWLMTGKYTAASGRAVAWIGRVSDVDGKPLVK